MFVDTTVPVIELKLHKDNSVDDLDGNVGDQITVNNTYNDPGYRVHDNDAIYDGTMSDTSNVDTSTVGTYYVKYDAIDDAGNIAQSVYRTVSVLSSDGSVDVKLPLTQTNPVIYSNGATLDASEWRQGKSITFNHSLTQIIDNEMSENAIIIKIEHNAILSTSDTTISNTEFGTVDIFGYSNNIISEVSIGHDQVSYDILHAPIMIKFLNVHNISAVPFYYNYTLTIENIEFYNDSIILDSSDANTTLSDDALLTNSTYNGTLYTKNMTDNSITIWTNHLTSLWN